jgi:transposase-like protein
MARRGRQFWQRAVAAAEVDGVSQAEVAARFGVRLNTLRSWIYRLRRERATAPTPGVRLLPVEVIDGPARLALIARVGDVAVEFAAGTDPAYVAAVLAALRAARC